MNPVLILTYNNLELTKRCVESVRAQDIETSIYVFDNGSSDGTMECLKSEAGIYWTAWPTNAGVSYGWNDGIGRIFGTDPIYNHYDRTGVYDHILVLNNDVVLPPWFYRYLLDYQYPFVTGLSVDSMEQIADPPSQRSADAHPDFSAFLIRRECWRMVGLFNERMKLYASDCDYHIRGHGLGVKMMKANVPFYHERSSTMKLAPDAERELIAEQANKDRATFKAIYGCEPGTPEYENLFK